MTDPLASAPPLPPERRPAVAQLIETLATGGAENLAVQIAGALAARGWRSHLYVLAGPGDLSGRVAPTVRLHYLHERRSGVPGPLAMALPLGRGLRRLRSLVRADGVRLVQTHLPAANYLGVALQATGAARAIATVHNNAEFAYGSRNRLRRDLRRAAYGRILRGCAAVACVSEQVRGSLLRELGIEPGAQLAERAVVVPNGVAVPAPTAAAERRRLRAAHGVEDDTVLILAAGRLCEQKNFQALVAAAALLPPEPDWRILIAGEGPDRPDLERRVAAAGLGARVRLPGNVADLTALMAAADVFALPSLWEGLPLTLLEAMAAALPVVGHRIPGVAEVVVPERSALLVEPGDVPALTAALSVLLPDPERRRRLGAAGLAIVRRDFDFERTVDRLEALYAAAMAPGG